MMTTFSREQALQRASLVRLLVQGHVVALADACVTLADARHPLSDAAATVASNTGVDSGMIVVPQDSIDNVVVLSQTCDLQETTTDEYHCLVAPVIRASTTFAKEALRGRRPAYAGLPWLDNESVADLSRITTVERSLLVDGDRLARPQSTGESLHFARTVSRFLTRPALPDEVNEILAPFLRRIKDRYDKRSAEGRCPQKVAEMRVEADPDFESSAPVLNVLMVVETADLPTLPKGADIDHERIDRLKAGGYARAAEAVEESSTPVARREAWTALCECWVRPSIDAADGSAAITAVDVEVLNGDELSYARSKDAPILDYRYLSTRAA